MILLRERRYREGAENSPFLIICGSVMLPFDADNDFLRSTCKAVSEKPYRWADSQQRPPTWFSGAEYLSEKIIFGALAK